MVARESRPLTVIADDIEGQALAALIMNAVRGTMKVSAIKAPRYGQERRNILSDLALSCGATYVSRESGKKLSEIKLSDLGMAKSIESSKSLTTIVGGKGDYSKVEERIESLKEEVRRTDDMVSCEKIQERITRLSSGIAIINVGGATEVEMIEKKHRIEDALEAVKSALASGIIPGGGTTLAFIADKKLSNIDCSSKEEVSGVEIIKQALFEPLRQLSKNADMSPDLAVEQVLRTSTLKSLKILDLEARDYSCKDFKDLGVIDPVKVTKSALRNAISVSSTLLSANYAIVDQGD